MTTTDLPAPEASSRPMTPGTYLRLRREAFGLTIEEVARMLNPAPYGLTRVTEQLRELEADEPLARQLDLAEDLHDIFAFDLDVFNLLVAHRADAGCELPQPQLCRICACSWSDPCADDRLGPCSWAEEDLCSHCLRAAAFGAAVVSANGRTHPAIPQGAVPIVIGLDLAKGEETGDAA